MDNETKQFISQEMEKLAQLVRAVFAALEKRLEAKEKVDTDLEWIQTVTKLNSNMVALKEFGCFVSVLDGTLFACPMNLDSSPDVFDDGRINWGEVTAPETQDFLDAVNRRFGTTFRLDQFAGR